MGDQAAIDRDDLVRPVPAQPGTPSPSTANCIRVRQPSRLGVDRLDLAVPRDAGQAPELLAHDVAEQLPLVGRVDVLEVAPSAPPRTRVRARRRDPVRVPPQHLDRVGAQERLARSVIVDAYAFTGQRVRTNTTRPSRRATQWPPCAIGPDIDDRVGHDQSAELRARMSPGAGRLRPQPSSSPRRPSAAGTGTLVTITPGMNSRRPLSRSALWLCSSCSHQWPTTYSGM